MSLWGRPNFPDVRRYIVENGEVCRLEARWSGEFSSEYCENGGHWLPNTMGK